MAETESKSESKERAAGGGGGEGAATGDDSAGEKGGGCGGTGGEGEEEAAGGTVAGGGTPAGPAVDRAWARRSLSSSLESHSSANSKASRSTASRLDSNWELVTIMSHSGGVSVAASQ